MAGPYSLDLRKRVVGWICAGHSCREAAARFQVSVASAVRWAQRERATGSCAARTMGGRQVKLAPHRAWLVERLMGKKGTRLVEKAPQGRWRTLTFLAALRHDRLAAPCVFQGAINGQSFLAYVRHVLVPTLRPGDIVILDNLGSHKSRAARQAIRQAGARLFFLPAYSPDLNPIEQVFSKLKHLLRKAGARTIKTLWQTIGQLLDSFTPQECANYLRNAGYASA